MMIESYLESVFPRAVRKINLVFSEFRIFECCDVTNIIRQLGMELINVCLRISFFWLPFFIKCVEEVSAQQ